MDEHSRNEPKTDRPGRGLLIAMIVFGVLLVAAVLWITIGYETSDEHGAVEPAPERVEESPAFEVEQIEPPAPERTAPTMPPPEGDPLGPPDPAVPPGND